MFLRAHRDPRSGPWQEDRRAPPVGGAGRRGPASSRSFCPAGPPGGQRRGPEEVLTGSGTWSLVSTPRRAPTGDPRTWSRPAITESGHAPVFTDEGTKEAAERLETFEDTINAAAAGADEGKSLMDFLDETALYGHAYDATHGTGRAEPDYLGLTCEGAWKSDGVVIVGMEERTFPHGRAFRGLRRLRGGRGADGRGAAPRRRGLHPGALEPLLTCARTRFLHGQRQVRSPLLSLGGYPRLVAAGAGGAVLGTAQGFGTQGGFGATGCGDLDE